MLQGAIKLFTIRGIEIRLDYSWFIIFVLVTWSLAGQHFPSQYPDWPAALHWSLGLVTSILFFLSVLGHELAHSFVAQRSGIPVPRITLFIFGGAAQIAEEPKSAKDEFVMALAGPAMSVLISMVSGGLWFLFRDLGVTPLAALFGWLSMINVMLAVFNLIPGFPLDGGRVLRALIWAATRDVGKSTRIAAGVGKLVAFFFIFMGMYLVFQGRIFNGIWIAFIGWFLLQAATQSSRRQNLKDHLAGHNVGEVMWTDCTFIDPDTNISELIYRHVFHTGHRCFPVLDQGKVSGIVTLDNLKSVPPELWARTRVGSVMVPASSLKSVTPETPLTDIMDKMAGEGIDQMPVVKEGSFLGMVTREAVLEFLKAKSELGLG